MWEIEYSRKKVDSPNKYYYKEQQFIGQRGWWFELLPGNYHMWGFRSGKPLLFIYWAIKNRFLRGFFRFGAISVQSNKLSGASHSPSKSFEQYNAPSLSRNYRTGNIITYYLQPRKDATIQLLPVHFLSDWFRISPRSIVFFDRKKARTIILAFFCRLPWSTSQVEPMN